MDLKNDNIKELLDMHEKSSCNHHDWLCGDIVCKPFLQNITTKAEASSQPWLIGVDFTARCWHSFGYDRFLEERRILLSL
jgi:hypothetical protein